MNNSRRSFIKNSGLAALSTPFLINALTSCNSNNNTTETAKIIDGLTGKSIEQFGIQLWTVKQDMAKDPKATLKALADYGYKQIESFTGDKGIFWGLTPKDFGNYMKDLGLNCISSHVNPDFTTKKETEDEFKKLCDDAASIGIKYLINPFPGEITSDEDWKKVTEGLNRQGEISKKSGIKTALHNHHIEFLPTKEGNMPAEMMLKGTNADLVDFELDLFWVVKAGQDPEKWLKDYPNRYRLCHIKDLYKAEKVAEIEKKEGPQKGFWPIDSSCALGQGRIDFAKILKTATENGMQYYIVEQERFDDSTPLKDAQFDADYMKKFKFA